MIRVLLVDNMPLMRAALTALLNRESDIDVVGDLATDSDIAPVAADLRPDVVVVNTDAMAGAVLPRVEGIRADSGGCPVLVLADPRKPVRLPRHRRENAPNVLIMDAEPELFGEAIRRVALGEQVTDPRITMENQSQLNHPLTRRELEVLALAADGEPVARIAQRLYLSLGTVRNYLSAIITKTGGRNRIDAIRIAREAGWLR